MDKSVPPSLFVNDGSFMERFKQLQQEKEKEAALEQCKSTKNVSGALKPNPAITKTVLDSKSNESRKVTPSASGGKLAFSLKQKSKLAVAPVKLGADEDEEEGDSGNGFSDGSAKRQKLDQSNSFEEPAEQGDVEARILIAELCDHRLIACICKGTLVIYAPPSPSDPAVKKVADKLASFVAKNGRQFEHITRQRNPGDTPFKFLFDSSCSDYKYYEFRLMEEEKALAQTGDSQPLCSGSTSTSVPRASSSQRPHQQHSNYQIPASALYESNEDTRSPATPIQSASAGRTSYGESSAPSAADSIAMMEFYMKKAAQEERRKQPKQSKDEMPPPASLQGESSASSAADSITMMEFYMKRAAQEERRKQPKQSKDEMPPPASLQGPVKRGHHMGDYIPPEELEKFLSSCNDAAARRAAREAAEKAKIQADNVGHKLLSKMGWKEGEGLGSSKNGIADPIMAGNVKLNNLGVGASQPGEVTPDDDIYEQYKKRMMLGYRYRPNPLNNPRKAYY
ncbi:PREDICTED: SURP and G-patch domain-containing protein 1-like protein isoform X2 [Nelumbo nucifera]|uniref:SURP and G-patch domain-containing protein 1-like protein isoform X2 n=1 Tax=Nelumbo nucifera TaxID=4432 RepID=A0A1U7ZUQ0_NELNU|nr:PREDICTED: SURP and G-patch domain-containing protein 1-like protein isoform X2 [Nelumbo nucifera]